MIRWAATAPLALLGVSGCLATKSDIQLLQTEARATRSQIAQGDTSILRADADRRAQIAQLSAKIDRMNDSLRVLAVRFAAFQATANGELNAMGQQLVQFQALLGQTTKSVQDTRRQLEVLREQGTTPAVAPPSTSAPGDTTQRPGSNVPGPATLYDAAMSQLQNGSFHTARTGFELLLTTYPNYENASAAMLHVGDAYKGERNLPAADSVYQLVVDRFPRSAEAPQALYRRGRILWDADKKPEARVIFARLVKDYPRSDEADLANRLLRP
jgi:tol-pal system protein YbgF